MDCEATQPNPEPAYDSERQPVERVASVLQSAQHNAPARELFCILAYPPQKGNDAGKQEQPPSRRLIRSWASLTCTSSTSRAAVARRLFRAQAQSIRPNLRPVSVRVLPPTADAPAANVLFQETFPGIELNGGYFSVVLGDVDSHALSLDDHLDADGDIEIVIQSGPAASPNSNYGTGGNVRDPYVR